MKSVFLVALMALGACVGTVQHEVLLPAAQSSWIGVRADLELGLADAVDAGDATAAEWTDLQLSAFALDEALAAGDLAALSAAPWSDLEPYAVRGVDVRAMNGEINDAGVQLLKQRIANFRAALDALAGREPLVGKAAPYATYRGVGAWRFGNSVHPRGVPQPEVATW